MLIAQRIASGDIILPTAKYASLGYTIKTIGSTIYLASATDSGISHGVYDLLQQYGAYFLISGEILPQQTAFAVKSLSISASPAFNIAGCSRGTIFFAACPAGMKKTSGCSSTAWCACA